MKNTNGKFSELFTLVKQTQYFLLGATFDRNKKLNTAILDYAVEIANNNILKGSDIELGSSCEYLDYGNEFMAAESVCRLLEVNRF